MMLLDLAGPTVREGAASRPANERPPSRSGLRTGYPNRPCHVSSCSPTSLGEVEPADRNAARALATPNTLYTPADRPGLSESNSSAGRSASRQRRVSHNLTSLP